MYRRYSVVSSPSHLTAIVSPYIYVGAAACQKKLLLLQSIWIAHEICYCIVLLLPVQIVTVGHRQISGSKGHICPVISNVSLTECPDDPRPDIEHTVLRGTCALVST